MRYSGFHRFQISTLSVGPQNFNVAHLQGILIPNVFDHFLNKKKDLIAKYSTYSLTVC